jgi:hypothetical protein
LGIIRVFLVAFAAILFASPAPASPSPSLGAGQKVLAAITYKNLTLMPVAAEPDAGATRESQRPKGKKKVPKVPDYVVLDEAMRGGKVKIQEESESGNVNELVISNKSDKPLFILGGEVIIGGKQDRIIAQDAIIAPRTTERLPVFCVEHGRWAGRKASFETAGALAHTELRKKAKYASSQAEVWEEVKSKNKKRRASNATDTYRGIATGKATRSSVSEYEKHFGPKLRALARTQEVVGFVVAMNGEIVAIEVFGSDSLFSKLQDKILRSYYVEAVDEPVTKGAKKAPTAASVSRFANQSNRAKARKKKVQKNKGSTTFHFEDAGLDGALLMPEGAAAPVYQSVHKKSR